MVIKKDVKKAKNAWYVMVLFSVFLNFKVLKLR